MCERESLDYSVDNIGVCGRVIRGITGVYIAGVILQGEVGPGRA